MRRNRAVRRSSFGLTPHPFLPRPAGSSRNGPYPPRSASLRFPPVSHSVRSLPPPDPCPRFAPLTLPSFARSLGGPREGTGPASHSSRPPALSSRRWSSRHSSPTALHPTTPRLVPHLPSPVPARVNGGRVVRRGDRGALAASLTRVFGRPRPEPTHERRGVSRLLSSASFHLPLVSLTSFPRLVIPSLLSVFPRLAHSVPSVILTPFGLRSYRSAPYGSLHSCLVSRNGRRLLTPYVPRTVVSRSVSHPALLTTLGHLGS